MRLKVLQIPVFHSRSIFSNVFESIVVVVVVYKKVKLERKGLSFKLFRLSYFYPQQVGVAAWLECWLSHLGVAGSSPGRDNL